MALLIAFALIGLVLAAVGLAAVIGYEVTERTHEIGIRMALGARTANVRRLAMRQGSRRRSSDSSSVWSALSFATRLAASLLYGVAPRDPLTCRRCRAARARRARRELAAGAARHARRSDRGAPG